jgi:hypothetical protein
MTEPALGLLMNEIKLRNLTRSKRFPKQGAQREIHHQGLQN